MNIETILKSIFGSNSAPWWVGIIVAAITCYVTYLATHKKSTDRSQSELLKQTVERQRQLDDRQQKMIDDFQEENNRQRDDIRLLREEVMAERRRNEKLGIEIHNLQWQNEELQRENIALKEQVRILKEELDKFKELKE